VRKGGDMLGLNRCILIGTIGRYGVDVRYAGSQLPHASFTLEYTESAQDGREHLTLIPCEVIGKKAELAAGLEPGARVVLDGKLARRKRGEHWELMVSGWDFSLMRTA
jgi:primosomal replication protein N